MQEQEQLHYHRCSIFADNLFSDQLFHCASIECDSDRWFCSIHKRKIYTMFEFIGRQTNLLNDKRHIIPRKLIERKRTFDCSLVQY
jgi:hypothetical protein